MSDYSPSSTSYKTPATSPSETLYNTENRIRFAPRGTKSSITDDIVVLDPRNLEARLDKATAENLALDSEAALLRYEMEDIFSLREEDLERDQRRHNRALLLCVLAVFAGFLWSWVFQRGANEVFELFDSDLS
ncbi:hypothetical protein FOCG_03795 [Fusarium oxysporum f. sp. radicis-lycopersici 26381]|uniref:Uncharacterized protein n=2 Tax=Fusarium oxysporum TaxID=5507 RepID=A0A420Q331_FUSOX|nr:uncharacterized protein FOBCDRAFT_319100 [Fusarium oxysporum Fo47]EWZ36627.1 hypothetical protein FOZG_10614 [Fusarium oxysporum Fo47]EXL56089.1 hypothetical protein FOCG_03795 [Fusarium oxysporum f. sp. radicis-lycopersici 26381]QKD53981.1 hypothetical protein FOBCDRAFT_319100 [Fusarium oxysporum Fo47]RKK99164.1 hypothetical protein BFJ68_g13299 [Fusarium oxysporum]